MSVLLEVEEIAVGDYSAEYGTVASVKDMGDGIELTFKNGTTLTPTKGTQLEIDQGGRFVHNGKSEA